VKFYDNGATICPACHVTCATCKDGNLPTNCLSCPDPTVTFRDNLSASSGGTCPCKDNYYETNILICPKCYHKCATCKTSIFKKWKFRRFFEFKKKFDVF